MKLYKFNQALSINGKDFKRGVHEIGEETEYHPHFLKYVDVGKIVEPEAHELPKDPKENLSNAAMLQKRAKALHERIKARKAAKSVAADPKETPAKPADPEVTQEIPQPSPSPSFDDMGEDDAAIPPPKGGKAAKTARHGKHA